MCQVTIVLSIIIPGVVARLCGTVYGLEGVSQAEATQRVKFIFGLLDTDGDEEISEEEFIRGCLEDQELVKLLQP